MATGTKDHRNQQGQRQQPGPQQGQEGPSTPTPPTPTSGTQAPTPAPLLTPDDNEQASEEYLLSKGWKRDTTGTWSDPLAGGKSTKVKVGELKNKNGQMEPILQTQGPVGNWRWTTPHAVTVQRGRDEAAAKKAAAQPAE